MLLPNAIINTASAADQAIVAAVAGKTIKIWQLQIMGTATLTIQVKDGAGGTALTGVETMVAGVPLVLPYTGVPWFVMSTGNAFVIATNAIQMSGHCNYTIEG